MKLLLTGPQGRNGNLIPIILNLYLTLLASSVGCRLVSCPQPKTSA
jgi:hypothetical protein